MEVIIREGHSLSTIPPSFPEQTKMYETFKSRDGWDFPGGPVVRLCLPVQGPGSMSDLRAKIPHA